MGECVALAGELIKRAGGRAEEDVAEEYTAGFGEQSHAVRSQFRNKLGFAETVRRWMFQQQLVDSAVERCRGNFAEQEASARLEYASDLRHCRLPVGYVMEDAEIGDRVETPSGKRKVLRVGESESYSVRIARQPFPRAADLRQVSIQDT